MIKKIFGIKCKDIHLWLPADMLNFMNKIKGNNSLRAYIIAALDSHNLKKVKDKNAK
jgi:hypothetical protein